jgi:hypothetical protein
VLLCKSDGTFIKADAGQEFMFNLDNSKAPVLTPGDYMVMIDPVWNDCAIRNKQYQEIAIDIYCNASVQITPIDDRNGFNTLISAFKDIALNTVAKKEREYYLRETDNDYANVFRVFDCSSTNIWYAYWFIQNDSPYRFKETFTPKPQGAQVIWPMGNAEEVEIDLAPGESQLILCRRT